MYHLVANPAKTHLLKRASHLVREPLPVVTVTVPVIPDEMAYYPLCGEYGVAGSDYSPGRGFCSMVGLIGSSHARQMGKTMRRAYLGTNMSTHQGWYKSTNRNPYFIFYHGNYGATAANTFCMEAYLQVPAYHFTVPSQYANYTVLGAALTVRHNGTIIAQQRAGNDKTKYQTSTDDSINDYYAAEAPTSILPAGNNWRGKWTQRIGIYSSLDRLIYRMHNSATDDVVLETDRVLNDLRWVSSGTSHSKTGRYSPVLGNLHLSYGDDGIPTTFSPWNQVIPLSSSIVGTLQTSRAGWIVISPNVGVTSNDNVDNAGDYPYWYDESAGWGRWLCCSFGDYALTLTLQKN